MIKGEKYIRISQCNDIFHPLGDDGETVVVNNTSGTEAPSANGAVTMDTTTTTTTSASSGQRKNHSTALVLVGQSLSRILHALQ